MDEARLEQSASLKRAGPPRDISARKGIVPYGFDKLSMVFASIPPSQYSYLDVVCCSTSRIHSARRLTYN
jgi:hypothetical protein